MNTAELQTLIILCGSNRIPDYEDEIFVNRELTLLYLRNLSADFYWFDGCSEHDNAWYMAFYYAVDHLNEAWPAAECIIREDGYFWDAYKTIFGIEETSHDTNN